MLGSSIRNMKQRSLHFMSHFFRFAWPSIGRRMACLEVCIRKPSAMHRPILLLLLLLIMTLPKAHAQAELPDRQGYLQLTPGFGRLLVRDRQVGDLVHRADLARIGFTYAHIGAKGDWVFQLAYGRGLLAPASTGPRTTLFRTWDWDGTVTDEPIPMDRPMWMAELRVARTFHAGPQEDGTGWYFGPAIGWSANRPQGFAPVGQMACATFDGMVGRAQQFGRHTVNAEFALTLVALMTREPWSRSVSVPGNTSRISSFFDSGTTWAAPWQVFQARLDVRYAYRVSDRFSLGLGLHIGYLNDAERHKLDHPAQLRLFDRRLEAALTYNFLKR